MVCWGLYSVPSWRKLEPRRYGSYAEWYYARVMDNPENDGKEFHEKNFGKNFDYHDFLPMFRAELWDPEFWAKTFKRSGARYVVLTAKYHDGYCLWPTKVPHNKNYNSMSTGPKRDLLGDLTKAVRAEGLRMGVYYSIPDWESVPSNAGEYSVADRHAKKHGVELRTYVEKMYKVHLQELVTGYKPSVIFSDAGEWFYDDEFWGTRDFLAWLYNESPVKDEIVVNDRFFKGMQGKHGDFYSSEYADAEVVDHPWEESRGIGGSYGYNRAENLDDYQSSGELIEEMIDVVGRGGNFLLNVGPTADGRIPVIQQQRLADIGAWLEVNGDAIYGTSSYKGSVKVVNQPDNTISFTTKADVFYVFCNEWPQSELLLSGLQEDMTYAVQLLGWEPMLVTRQQGDRLHVKVPNLSPAQIPCSHAWAFKISPKKN